MSVLDLPPLECPTRCNNSGDAAGLSALKFWRFAIATVAGIIPASLFLTHFGGVLADGDGMSVLWASLALGGVTGFPLLYLAWRSRRQARVDDHAD